MFFDFLNRIFFEINNRERCLRVLIEIGDIVVHRIARGSERNNDDGPCYVSRNGVCTLRVVRVSVNDIDQPPKIDRFLSNTTVVRTRINAVQCSRRNTLFPILFGKNKFKKIRVLVLGCAFLYHHPCVHMRAMTPCTNIGMYVARHTYPHTIMYVVRTAPVVCDLEFRFLSKMSVIVFYDSVRLCVRFRR